MFDTTLLVLVRIKILIYSESHIRKLLEIIKILET